MSQAQVLPVDHFSPSVSLIEGRPATTSLAIAEHFGKRHDDVLKSIRKLCAELPADIRARNFAETIRTVAGPKNSQRQEVFFTVYFDGFILLVMGYTGKPALQIKLVYIAAFNAMRDELAARHEAVILPSGDTLSPAEQAHLHAIVSAKAGMLPADIQRKVRSEIWTRFNRHFSIARYAQLPPAKMGEAVEYLVGMEVKAQKALPTNAEQAAASALEVYTKSKRTSPPDYRTHSEVKARLRGVQRDLIENANTLLACLENIDKKVLDAFHNPARRGEIATHTDNVLDHFRRSLIRSREALENQLNACNDTLSGVIGMARILENPQAAGKAVMYGVQTF